MGGLIGTGLSLIERSVAEPPSIQGRGLGDLGGTLRSHPAIRTNDPPPCRIDRRQVENLPHNLMASQ
jgi:hypothetical protein